MLAVFLFCVFPTPNLLFFLPSLLFHTIHIPKLSVLVVCSIQQHISFVVIVFNVSCRLIVRKLVMINQTFVEYVGVCTFVVANLIRSAGIPPGRDAFPFQVWDCRFGFSYGNLRNIFSRFTLTFFSYKLVSILFVYGKEIESLIYVDHWSVFPLSFFLTLIICQTFLVFFASTNWSTLSHFLSHTSF